jgi:hypothetical protein
MIANWVFASNHSCGGIFHSPAASRKTRDRSRRGVTGGKMTSCARGLWVIREELDACDRLLSRLRELAATIAKLLPRIAHVQIADNPGRNEPGTYKINCDFLGLGTTFQVSADVMPLGEPMKCLAGQEFLSDPGRYSLATRRPQAVPFTTPGQTK